MSRFQYALKIVLGHEGGYADVLHDRGGKTNYGVTQKTLDDFCKLTGRQSKDVKDITMDEVEAIYSTYWKDAHCAYMPEDLDVAHFDFCINAGARRANKMLQRVLGVDEDGVIGRQTLDALHEEVVAGSVEDVVAHYMAERRDFYRGLVERDPTQKRFIKGWLARVDHLEDLINLPVIGSDSFGGMA